MTLSMIGKPNKSSFIGEKIDQDITLILIQFDASLSERYTRTKEVTNHPVESGADVTDHTRVLPLEITIHGWVTDDPIIFLKSLRALPSVSGGSPLTRSFDAWRELNRIMDEESTLKVVTDLDEFENMVLTGIDTIKEKDTGRILDATITLKKITIATTEVVDAPEPQQENRSDKTNNGKKTGKDPDASTSKSFLATLASKGS